MKNIEPNKKNFIITCQYKNYIKQITIFEGNKSPIRIKRVFKEGQMFIDATNIFLFV